ncbi:uncharacterized protein LOC125140839 [Tachysurus fulvidraco]|uniref:uncharacterized protein LOC125140839 n=1 Tax=Tachysurus fulvidraco TaxID=1234273 RepID=UPI001FEEDF51|nr:uncharacterized protein LOC125140839 [Tachysurus fulvidraco]
MCIIIREMMNLFWIIGLLWSGVITSGDVTAAPAVGTRTSKNESSAFMISIKIINQIYNDSLEDHQSQNYKTLRQKVENVFFEIYKFTPSVQYQEITEMTFSNGSVIANSTVIFGSKQKSGEIVKQIFVKNYMQHHSPLRLDLNINYTADQEAIAVPSMTISISIPETHDNSTNSAISTTSASISTNGLDKSKDKTQPPKTSTQAHSNNSPSNSPSDNMTPTTSPSRTHMFDSSAPTNPSHNILTTSASSFSTSTYIQATRKQPRLLPFLQPQQQIQATTF